jgi:GTP-binding protein EngB required for normal cell division
MLDPETFITSRLRSPELIRIIGIAAVAFFGLYLILIVRKLFDNRVGLTIDQNGITDNSSSVHLGLIEWDDILEIEAIQIASTKMLKLKTDKPEKYIDRAKNTFIKRAMAANHKLYGSPFTISSVSLKVKFDELEKIVMNEFNKRRGSN